MATSHHLTCTCGALSEAVLRAKRGLVSSEDAAERLAATGEFLNEIEAKRPTMDWQELVEVVDDLRGQFD